MIVGRVVGWIALLSGAAVLVRDLLVWIDTKHWAPIALGQLWYDLNRSSLNLSVGPDHRQRPVVVGLCGADGFGGVAPRRFPKAERAASLTERPFSCRPS